METTNKKFEKNAAYPNQRVIKIVNEPTKQPFAQINIDVLGKAAKDLIPPVFPPLLIYGYIYQKIRLIMK